MSVTSTARPPRRLRFSDRAARGTVLAITLRRTARSVRIRLTAPSLLARGARGPHSLISHGRQVVTISVVDAGARHTQISEKVAVTGR